MLQKAGKTAAGSEFCLGRRNVFAAMGNIIFFVGHDILDREPYNTAIPSKIIKRLP